MRVVLLLRESLLENEKEMACCEAETLEFGVSCREVAVEMAESQKRMQETAEKLGKEVEVLKQKEFVAIRREEEPELAYECHCTRKKMFQQSLQHHHIHLLHNCLFLWLHNHHLSQHHHFPPRATCSTLQVHQH